MRYTLAWRTDSPSVRRPNDRRRVWIAPADRLVRRRTWAIERLEPRCLLSALRLVSWNTLNNPNEASDDLNVRAVLEAIGNESIEGNAGPVDVLALQETDPPSTARLEAILDDLYADDYASVITSLDGGGDATAFVYNTNSVSLLDSVELTGPLTHHTVRARFQYRDAGDTADFYAYTIHLRSGGSSEARTQRELEANFLRADAESLGAGENVLFVGDFNMAGSSEAAYAAITAPGEAQTLDVANAPGQWSDNPAFIDLHTHNSLSVGSRLDLQFASEELRDGSGLDFVADSFRVFGNNGTHTLNAPLSTGTGQTSAVLSALEAASDHLPIIADYEIINDVPAVIITESQGSTIVVEGGQNDTYSIVLNTLPTDDVDVTIDPGVGLDAGAGPGVPFTLTFTPLDGLTPRTVVLHAVDDMLPEGNHSDTVIHSVSSLDPLYNVLVLDDVSAEIRDDDAPGFVINEIDSDTDGSDQLEFIELYDGGVGNAPLDGLSLVFWNGFNDSSYFALDLDGFTTGPDGFFVAGNAAVANVDAVFSNGRLQNGADAVGLYEADASSFPGGAPVTLTNLLDAIVYDTNDADDPGLAPLLLPNQPQRNEDENGKQTSESLARIPDGGVQRESSTVQAGSPTPGVPNVLPTPGIRLVQSGSGTDVVESGLGDSYTLVLDSQPTSDVSITATPSDQIDLGAGAGIAVGFTFTSLNWNIPQTVSVAAVDDEIAEGLHDGVIMHSTASSDAGYASLSIPNVGVDITDDEQRRLLINEIDSDTSGVDALEFVELYDGGAGNTSLNNIVVVFFNGSDDQQYASFDLDGFSTDAAGFFVLGNAAAPEVDLVFNDNTLQNGADAVALYLGQASQFTSVTTTNLIDAVVYDTDDADDFELASLLVQGGQVDENGLGDGVDMSLARVPDGGQERSTLDYINQFPTPGTFNITAAVPAVRVVEKRTREGQTTNLDFALNSTPSADVFLKLFPDTQLDLGSGGGVPITLVFTPGNATDTQALTVSIVDDSIVEGPHFGRLAYRITSADTVYNDLEVDLTYIAIEDDDFASAPLNAEAAAGVSTGTTAEDSDESSASLPPTAASADASVPKSGDVLIEANPELESTPGSPLLSDLDAAEPDGEMTDQDSRAIETPPDARSTAGAISMDRSARVETLLNPTPRLRGRFGTGEPTQRVDTLVVDAVLTDPDAIPSAIVPELLMMATAEPVLQFPSDDSDEDNATYFKPLALQSPGYRRPGQQWRSRQSGIGPAPIPVPPGRITAAAEIEPTQTLTSLVGTETLKTLTRRSNKVVASLSASRRSS
ncbi:MAG: endonuclease/exonuclease/phosphatase family protein [Planctomycetota bacterium]